MTPCAASTETPGEILLPMPSGKSVRIHYDSRVLTPSVEEIRLEDPQLRRTWGDRLFRILLRAAAPPTKAAWAMRITS